MDIDHQPARIIFPKKHRPKGLEFPACQRCNKQIGRDEVLLALICRLTGSHRPHAPKDFGRLGKIRKGVERGFPGLLKRISTTIWVWQNGVLVRTGAFNLDHDIVYESMCRMAARIALATYYTERGKIADPDTVINCMWSHAQHQAAPSIDALLAKFPKHAALKQGKWNTTDSFYVKWYADDDALTCAAVFHESVAVMAAVYDSRTAFGNRERWHALMAPSRAGGIIAIP